MCRRIAVWTMCLGVGAAAAEGAYFGLAPERSVWGTGELRVRLDLPEATQGWSYGVRVQDCEHARFLSARILNATDMFPPGYHDFGDVVVEDCVIVRSVVLNLVSPVTIGPVNGYEDLAISYEAWEPTEVSVCATETSHGMPVALVVLVAGASKAATGGTAQVGLAPIANFTCTPAPLACGAWKVEMRWERTGACDRVRIYEDGALLAEGPGDSYGGVYRSGARTVELAVEPVLGTHVGARLTCAVTIPTSRTGFIRGDANQDEEIDLADAIAILQHLFGSGWLFYEPAADVNADTAIDIADAICLLQYLFRRGTPPSAPFPECGIAP